MLVVRTLFSPLPHYGLIIRLITLLIPTAGACKTIFLNTTSNCNSRINTIWPPIFWRCLNQSSHRQANRFAYNNSFSCAENGKHFKQSFEIV